MRYYIPAVIYISFVSIRRNGHTHILHLHRQNGSQGGPCFDDCPFTNHLSSVPSQALAWLGQVLTEPYFIFRPEEFPAFIVLLSYFKVRKEHLQQVFSIFGFHTIDIPNVPILGWEV